MNEYDVKRLALILALQAEIEGIKLANNLVDFGMEPYSERDFKSKAEELREFAYKHNYQL